MTAAGIVMTLMLVLTGGWMLYRTYSPARRAIHGPVGRNLPLPIALARELAQRHRPRG